MSEQRACIRIHDNSGMICPDCGSIQHIKNVAPFTSSTQPIGSIVPDNCFPYIVDESSQVISKPLTVTLSRQEINLILRIRQAAEQGRMVLIDPDAMVWYLVGKMENTP
jgi:hypothetical protein